MPSFADLDSITLDDLRRSGSMSWSNPGLIGAFVAEMAFGVPAQVKERLSSQVLRQPLGYSTIEDLRELQYATAGFLHQNFDWEVHPDAIQATADVIAIYVFVLEHIVDPDRPVVIPTPAYMPFREVLEALDRSYIEVPMKLDDGRYTNDTEGIRAAFEAGAQLLVLCNPHNPTGRSFAASELRAVSDLVADYDGLVFADEIWSPLTRRGTHTPFASLSAQAAAQSITAISATKAFNMAGAKCAQVILTNENHAEIWRKKGWIPLKAVSTLGAAASSTAYSAGAVWLDEIRRYLERNRDELVNFVAHQMPGVRIHTPDTTYIAWLDCSELGVSDPRSFFLERAGVEMTEGSRCGAGFENHLRFTFPMPNPIMHLALTRMRSAALSIP